METPKVCHLSNYIFNVLYIILDKILIANSYVRYMTKFLLIVLF